MTNQPRQEYKQQPQTQAKQTAKEEPKVLPKTKWWLTACCIISGVCLGFGIYDCIDRIAALHTTLRLDDLLQIAVYTLVPLVGGLLPVIKYAPKTWLKLSATRLLLIPILAAALTLFLYWGT